jgi:putative DNA primase/helicase
VFRSFPYLHNDTRKFLCHCCISCARIEHLLVTNEFSDRVYDLRDGDTKTVRNLLAYRKVGVEGCTEELWVPPTVLDKEFVGGVNKAELVKELQRLGWLLPPRPDGKTLHTRRVNGKRIYFYVFQKHENGGVPGVPGVPES